MTSSTQTQPTRRQWHNHLPAWIVQSQPYQASRPCQRAIMQAIANRCDTDAAGNLTGAFGGRSLIEAVGCSRATFWRNIAPLIAAGFVVPLSRGGRLGANIQAPNQYGLPGRPGGLNHRRAGGTPNGPQLNLSGADPPTDSAPQNEAPPRLKMRRPPSQNEAQPSLYIPGYPDKNHGAARRKAGEPRIGSIRLEDLQDTARLMALHRQAVGRGYIDGSDHGRLMFTAAAEHALRLADKPPGMFAWIVKRKRWLFVTNADEAAAARRIKVHDHGPDPARRRSSRELPAEFFE